MIFDYKTVLYKEKLDIMIKLALIRPDLFWKSRFGPNYEFLEGKFMIGTNSVGERSKRTNIYVPEEYWDLFEDVKEIPKAYKCRNLVTTSQFIEFYNNELNKLNTALAEYKKRNLYYPAFEYTDDSVY